ncbi:integrase catalytic domain-containing protein [Pycnococcus provasolii]
MELTDPIPRQARWIVELQEYMPVIRYLPGSSELLKAVDCLSRPATQVSPALNAVDAEPADATPDATHDFVADASASSTAPRHVDVLSRLRACNDDEELQRLRVQRKWHSIRGLTYDDTKRSRLIVADRVSQQFLIALHHELPLVGHRGADSTVELLMRNYLWINMREHVRDFIASCPVCAANKNRPSSSRTPGILQPVPHPTTRFSVIAMDFLGHLPKTKHGNDTILTVTDRSTRLVKLIATTETANAQQTALLFRKHVFSPGWGLPQKIISDRDPRFISEFWKDLMALLGCRSAMTSGYHPQPDAAESVNRLALKVLRSLLPALANRWDEMIDLVEFALNNAVCSTTGCSAFMLGYGHHPRSPLGEWHDADEQPPDTAALAFFLTQQATLEAARRHTTDAAAASISSWDTSHPPAPTYKEGDRVWLSSAPFNLSKTAPRWLGPYKIAEVRSPTTFRLELPANWGAHPVWHSEHLRAAGELRQTTHYTPVIDPPLRIEQILAHKRLRGRGMQYELTVKWHDFPLGHLPLTVSLPDALLKGKKITQEYFARWNLGSI